MPDESDTLTPGSETAPNSLTSGSGTAASSSDDGSRSEPASPPTEPVDWEGRYKASSREVNSIRQRQMQLENESAQYRNWVQQQQMAQQQPVQQQEPQRRVRGKKLLDTLLAGDENAAESLLDEIESSASRRAQRELAGEIYVTSVKAGKAQAAQNYLNGIRELKDGNHPLTQEAIRIYTQKMADPYSDIDRTQVDQNGFNPVAMKYAVMEAQVNVGASRSAAERERRDAPSFDTEPAAARQAAPSKPGAFDAQKHLTETDRAAARDMKMPYADYFKHLNQKLRDARLKAGRPLEKHQI